MIHYTKEHIQALLDRYMLGETTIDEERLLEDYFRRADVPQEWSDYRMLFAEVDAMRPRRVVSLRRWSVAAAVVVLLGLSALWLFDGAVEQTSDRPLAGMSAPSEQPVDIQPVTNDVAKGVLLADEKPRFAVQKATYRTPESYVSEAPHADTLSEVLSTGVRDMAIELFRDTLETVRQAKMAIAEARLNIEKAWTAFANSHEERLVATLKADGYSPVRLEDGTIVYEKELENIKYMAYGD